MSKEDDLRSQYEQMGTNQVRSLLESGSVTHDNRRFTIDWLAEKDREAEELRESSQVEIAATASRAAVAAERAASAAEEQARAAAEQARAAERAAAAAEAQAWIARHALITAIAAAAIAAIALIVSIYSAPR
jgi:hypothetical protein